ncbi:MAG TPA: MFS transporter [Selenomonadales bacterium]|nr:MFS transporter [Selenomonadales bacterium]
MLGLPKGVPLLIANSLFTSIGFYAFIPFLSIYLVDYLAWPPLLVGLLLTVRQVSQQGPTFLTGMFADRVGLKLVMCIGLVIRSVGFAMFAFVDQIATMFLAAVIAGLGGALFGPTGSGLFAHLTPEEERVRVYSLQKAVSNIGIALSAGLGAVLIYFDFALLSLVCGGIYLVLAIISHWYLPDVRSPIKRWSYKDMGRVVMTDRNFLLFTAIMTGIWYIYMQLYFTIPLQLYQQTGNKMAVSLVNLVVAGVVILFQYPVVKYLTGRRPFLTSLTIGALALGAGALMVGLSGSLAGIIIGLVFFGYGIIIVEPVQYDLTSRLANGELLATYFGFASLAIAVGGGCSQGIGGWLFQQGPALLWGSCGAVCLLVVYGLRRLGKRDNLVALGP